MPITAEDVAELVAGIKQIERMPRYRNGDKVVQALKIADIEYRPYPGWGVSDATITPVEEGHEPISVSWEYVKKHDPQVGGYYVFAEPGGESFSPAETFEASYTLESGSA